MRGLRVLTTLVLLTLVSADIYTDLIQRRMFEIDFLYVAWLVAWNLFLCYALYSRKPYLRFLGCIGLITESSFVLTRALAPCLYWGWKWLTIFHTVDTLRCVSSILGLMAIRLLMLEFKLHRATHAQGGLPAGWPPTRRFWYQIVAVLGALPPVYFRIEEFVSNPNSTTDSQVAVECLQILGFVAAPLTAAILIMVPRASLRIAGAGIAVHLAVISAAYYLFRVNFSVVEWLESGSAHRTPLAAAWILAYLLGFLSMVTCGWLAMRLLGMECWALTESNLPASSGPIDHEASDETPATWDEARRSK